MPENFGSCVEGKFMLLVSDGISFLTIISASTTLRQGHRNLDDIMQEKAQLYERLRADIGMT